jgi:hypothetical protein
MIDRLTEAAETKICAKQKRPTLDDKTRAWAARKTVREHRDNPRLNKTAAREEIKWRLLEKKRAGSALQQELPLQEKVPAIVMRPRRGGQQMEFLD